MAAVVLKGLCRRREAVNGLLRLRVASKALNARTFQTEFSQRFSAFALHSKISKSDRISSVFLRNPGFRRLHEQALASSDASENRPVYEDADEQAAASAFQSHLQKHSKAYLTDAAAVVANAPLFVKQLVDLVKQQLREPEDGVEDEASERKNSAGFAESGKSAEEEGSPEVSEKTKTATAVMDLKPENVTTSTTDSKPGKEQTSKKKKGLAASKIGAELSFEKQVLSYLMAADISVLEAILESIGMGSDRSQQLQQRLAIDDVIDVQLFLFVIRWLERLGFLRSDVGDIVEREPGVVSLKGDEIEGGFAILKDLSVPEEEILRLIKRYPLVLRAVVAENIAALRSELSELPSCDVIISKAVCRNPVFVLEYEKGCAESVLQYLRSYGLTEERLDQIFQRHFRLLFLDVETNLKDKVKFLKELGLSRVVIGKVLRRSPGFLLRSLEENLKSRLVFFKSLGITDANFASMVSRYPSIFSASLEKKIKPAVEELRTLGLSEEGLKKVVLYRPCLFAHKLGGDISSLILGLKDANYSDRQKVTAFVKLYTRGIDHRKRCEECLMRFGLTASEANQVLDKEPEILGYSEKDISSRLEHLTGTLGAPVQNVISAPSYLSAGFKSRFLRRQRVLAYMKSKGLLTNDVSLKHVLSPSNGQFFKKYVKPHAEDQELSKIWHKEQKGMGKEDGLHFILNYPAEVPETGVNA